MTIEDLYDRFAGKLYSYLSLKLRSCRDAEDVLQNVFCRLIKYRFRLGLIRNPNAFLFKVARNEAHRFFKQKAKFHQGCQAISLMNVIPNILSGPDSSDLLDLGKALERIAEDQREVIFLKFFEELTFREIASIFNISVNTAASRYRYGLEKLRFVLKEKP